MINKNKESIFRNLSFFMFILSGVASISYQLLWLRDAITYFGVISPVISAVISVFMMGLCAGNYFAGKLSIRISSLASIRLYCFVEVLIGLSAILVPYIFHIGYNNLLTIEGQTSNSYLFYSWLVITISLFPSCFLIGATYPLIMRFLQNKKNQNNFSYLYFANLIGAFVGSILPLVIIEIYGFKYSLLITTLFNFIAAIIAFFLSTQASNIKESNTETLAPENVNSSYRNSALILFVTGYAALSGEIMWIKLFTPVVGTAVYSFALILAIYLIFNMLGTNIYRNIHDITKKNQLNFFLLIFPAAAILPLAMPMLPVLSIIPVCFCFGFITPYVIDKTSNNNPAIAAKLYNYNFAGCIVGPLVTSYILYIPFGLKIILIFNGLLLFVLCIFLLRSHKRFLYSCIAISLVFAVIAINNDTPEETIKKNGMLTRDHIGYVGAVGVDMQKMLKVNGIGMTTLTTITKNMAYLPLAQRPDSKSVLVICFGMGTTIRSYTTWPVSKITAVELSSGVINSFGYFHADAKRVLSDPRVNIVNDDGRRFLNRTNEKFDIITLDPPPPVFSSGSGLLYSKEFIALAKSRLGKNGILAHWIPEGDALLLSTVVNAIKINFKNIIVYKSIEDWGYHIIASDSELENISPEKFASKLPGESKKDLLEWQSGDTIEQIAKKSLNETPLENLTIPGKENLILSDDFLFNEFFILRKFGLLY